MTTLYRFDIRIKLRGPVLTKSTSPSTFGLDAAIARDFKDDRPILPGTLLEGRICEALFILEETARLKELFGANSDVSAANEPIRGALLIGDLHAQDNGCSEATISRVKMDAQTGTAAGEMLRVIETPYLSGKEVSFKGAGSMFCEGDVEAREIARLLEMGLRWQMQVGSLRTTGFGRLLEANVEPTPESVRPLQINGSPAALDLEISPLGPLCIAKPKIGGNLFESDTVIPGNMLAGAVMQTAKALGVDIPEFDKIRFRHAFPSKNGARACPIPLSTVKVDKKTHDISACDKPTLCKNGKDRLFAPEFPVDWKEHDDVLDKLGWAFPATELRVRTAIDSQKRTAMREGEDTAGGSLFAWELVHPFVDDEDKTPISWRTRIDLGGVADKQTVVEALAKVLPYLSFVSKTKARCEVKHMAVDDAEKLPDGIETKPQLALLLRTPALLIDPRFQDISAVGAKDGALSSNEVFNLYAAVWSDLSDGALKLSHLFASQSLAGGNYLAKRFQAKHKPNAAYNPYLLTDAGSVFVFDVKDATKAKDKVEEWLASGVLPQWAIDSFGETWQHNPYIPTNGFGEIALHEPKYDAPETEPIKLADRIPSTES